MQMNATAMANDLFNNENWTYINLFTSPNTLYRIMNRKLNIYKTKCNVEFSPFTILLNMHIAWKRWCRCCYWPLSNNEWFDSNKFDGMVRQNSQLKSILSLTTRRKTLDSMMLHYFFFFIIIISINKSLVYSLWR